jgi:NADPH:quinone reductase-like Zn-dependent oxidoreductase
MSRPDPAPVPSVLGMRTQLPTTATAVHLDHYGPPADVEPRTVQVPTPADDQVVVRVRAAGINRGDGLAVEGLPYAARLSYGVTRPKQPVPGTDVAGHVEAVGAGVDSLRPGDTVLGWASGAFAEYAAAPAAGLVPKPEAVSFEAAAATPTAAVTALQALRLGRATGGRHVLVVGASGGVGSFAVQLAKARGAEVTGVCSTRNLSLVRSLGADHVVDHTAEDPTAARRRYDAVVDLAGRRPLSSARRVLRPGGTYVVVGGGNPRSLTGTGRFVAAALLSPLGPERLRPLFASQDREDLETVVSLLSSGEVRPFVEAAYRLPDAADALDVVHRGRARGKVVLVP